MSYIPRYITVWWTRSPVPPTSPPGHAPASPLTRRAFGWGACVTAFLALAAPLRAEQILILAAASTTDAISEIISVYESATGAPVAASFGASSALARQVDSGAPAHLYLSAAPRWMDYLTDAGAILADSRVDLLANRLALVAPAESGVIEIAFDRPLPLGDSRLAVGDPDHVPAGLYAKAALQHLGLWDAAVPRLVRSQNVRAALVLVERGEVPLGVVYATDARVTDGVRVVSLFPADSHPPIRYPLAMITDSPEARAFYDFLLRDQAGAIFARHGFAKP